MNDFQSRTQLVDPVRGHVRSPHAATRADANSLFRRDSMVGIHWTCGDTAASTAAKTFAKTWEGDSNTESEVASA